MAAAAAAKPAPTPRPTPQPQPVGLGAQTFHLVVGTRVRFKLGEGEGERFVPGIIRELLSPALVTKAKHCQSCTCTVRHQLAGAVIIATNDPSLLAAARQLDATATEFLLARWPGELAIG